MKLLIGRGRWQGDFVYSAAKGTHEGKPRVSIDLYRVENEKMVEHWDFLEMVPPAAEWGMGMGCFRWISRLSRGGRHRWMIAFWRDC